MRPKEFLNVLDSLIPVDGVVTLSVVQHGFLHRSFRLQGSNPSVLRSCFCKDLVKHFMDVVDFGRPASGSFPSPLDTLLLEERCPPGRCSGGAPAT